MLIFAIQLSLLLLAIDSSITTTDASLFSRLIHWHRKDLPSMIPADNSLILAQGSQFPKDVLRPDPFNYPDQRLIYMNAPKSNFTTSRLRRLFKFSPATVYWLRHFRRMPKDLVAYHTDPPLMAPTGLVNRITDATRLSYLVHCQIRYMNCHHCLSDKLREARLIRRVSDGDAEYAIFLHPRTRQVILVFDIAKTSDDFTNILERTKLVPFQEAVDDGIANAKIHTGFYQIWKQVEQDVLDSIIRAVKDMYKNEWKARAGRAWELVTTGFSKGGSLAQIAGISLFQSIKRAHTGIAAEFRLPSQVTVFSFGAMRIFNAEAAKYVANLSERFVHYRITHSRDPVPHMLSPQAGYRHAGGIEIHIADHQAAQWRMLPSQDDKEDSRGIWRYFKWVNLDDHARYFDFRDKELNCEASPERLQEYTKWVSQMGIQSRLDMVRETYLDESDSVGSAYSSETDSVGSAYSSETDSVGSAYSSKTDSVGSAYSSKTDSVGSVGKATLARYQGSGV